MKKWGIVLGLLAAGSSALPIPASAQDNKSVAGAQPAVTEKSAAKDADIGIQWSSSVDGANAQAKASGKLIMADFYTTWCHWCTKLDKETYVDPRVALLSEEFVSMKINAEKGRGPGLAETYGVSSYPNIVFLGAEGAVVERIGGFMEAGDFARQMAKVLQANSEERMKQEAAGSKDAAPLLRLSVMHASLGDVEKAATYLGKAEKVNAKSADPKKNAARLTTAYIALGEQYIKEDDYERAIGVFSKARTTADDLSDLMTSRLRLAYCYIENGQPEKATADLNAILAMKEASKEEKAKAQELLDKAK